MVHSMLSPPLDLSHHFSSLTKRREASEIKGLYKYFFIPGIANLAGGLPNASFFPYDTLEATVAHPERFSTTPGNDQTKNPGDSQSTERRIVPKESQTTNLLKKIDLTTALQYGTAEGYPVMADFVRQFTRNHLHPNVPYAGGPDTLLTCGSTDGFSKAIETFTSPWDPRRDWISQREGILCEEFVYMNAIQTVNPRGLNVAPVAMDAQGMLAHGKGGLADVLENWDFRKGRLPHLMYTITIGQNPTGGTLSVERRKEIYALCRQYDIIIIEDDPYWNLQYPSAAAMEAQFRGSAAVDVTPRNYNAHGRSSGYEFLDSLVPSYLSVDTDGRVVRLDTFSKTIAPGCRLGWITAQPAIIERLTRLTETSTQQPSGFVQAMVAELIVGQQTEDGQKNKSKKSEQAWQMTGWVRWLEGLRAGYERRMQAMCTILEEGKYSIDAGSVSDDTHDEGAWEVLDKVQMYEFSWPTGGMFVWIKVCIETHPLLHQFGQERLSKALWVHLMQKPYLCLLGPGTMFAPTPEVLERAQEYYRLCFAAMPAEDVPGISQRLVDGFRTFWQRKDLDGLDDDEEVALKRLQVEIAMRSGPSTPAGVSSPPLSPLPRLPPSGLSEMKMTSPLEVLQNTDLAEEIEAINAIYDPDTLTITTTTSTGPTLDLGGSSSDSPPTTIKLQLPEHPHLSFLLGFDSTYPDTPPKILGTASTASRGEGKLAVDVLEEILGRTYQVGAVCLFDLINDAVQAFTELNIGGANSNDTHAQSVAETAIEDENQLTPESTVPDHRTFNLTSPPQWILSDIITEKKSVFVGRAAHVTSLDQAKAFLDHLLATEKKVATATHNISAWRIREVKSTAGGSNGGGKNGDATEMIVQDCDDDGETAAGGRLLHLMQLMDVWDVVVVVTRWYGGVLLGPDRFRIINAAGKDALMKGGFVREKAGEKGRKKGKK
ncbi:PLP-dependent transferase [Aspergillus ibericus CBS 121593]|uniref:PLP-dependent transferase n=1 Tax=Aspergillus ibericus CBS 121593 TaxID=1448316 RepID=A0A395H4S6_9EURO|nr:PLP-dependent transferase [Aspergillus ibericus CBS 121593]RAL01888.1 PLP-dependent transferase [Aspergillus ibericus CBS 121593]